MKYCCQALSIFMLSVLDKLMYKTAVYTLVNGGITHQKQQIPEKGDNAAIHRLSVNVLPRIITFFRYLLFLMCNTAIK